MPSRRAARRARGESRVSSTSSRTTRETTVIAARSASCAEGLAHCFEAAVCGAAALRQIGYRPLIVNLFPEPGIDDEHLLAIYGEPGAWGAVAKSNYAGLRYREPIYRSLRELVISYFEHYYNLAKDKTLRSYSRPLNLAGFDRYDWLAEDDTMKLIEESPELDEADSPADSIHDPRAVLGGRALLSLGPGRLESGRFIPSAISSGAVAAAIVSGSEPREIAVFPPGGSETPTGMSDIAQEGRGSNAVTGEYSPVPLSRR